MKHPFRFSILPYFTLGAGGIGLILRLWLFSATDAKGLLPASHPADTLLYILSALVLAVLFLACREPGTAPFRRRFRQIGETAGNLIASVCLILYGFLGHGILLSAIACLIGGIALLFSAFLAWKRKSLPYWVIAVLTVALMVITVTKCRAWGAIPQLQHYIFPLLACVFLILTAYHRTTLAAKQGKRRHVAFFSQGALFFCLLSLNSDPILCFGMACWAAAQLFPCYHTKKEP